MSASQIGQNGRGKLIAVDKATEENCRSCDPDRDRKIHNGKCPCCEVITKSGNLTQFSPSYMHAPFHLSRESFKFGRLIVRLIIGLLKL